ncbi:hypothetical protein BJF93_02010 [Xaviernesmea oryzae]|uniref:DUF3311 domain-containing protein n=1 Tax=Xaviernesmea oryzae TaxID=464029 RepID=A0A1Q9AYU6_9HYPH|nr:DUF3311 domain-containing protein [Xaviernesmea oryzae]OLP60876.1 hypothetical protein BJF93_02010 [Xaviernesmea oryzae]SEL23268.1 Protein of unknown function [Xaviernesmea oryzae]
MSRPSKTGSRAALWLLVLPYIGLLWVPFYNMREPALFGFPFFYWYQLGFVPLTSILIYIAYRSVRDDD